MIKQAFAIHSISTKYYYNLDRYIKIIRKNNKYLNKHYV